MKSIVELGKQGSDSIDLRSTAGVPANAYLQQLTAIIRQLPAATIEADTSNGVKKTVETHMLPLRNSRVFALSHQLALYEPIVYARVAGAAAMGMLSVNYDVTGSQRLPSLKLIPLRTPYPLRRDLNPDARMATMLAGAVSSERQGVGGHSGEVQTDLEHRMTILGATSLARPDIAVRHDNHAVRSASSVATGLTDGQLGNVYTPDKTLSDFTGYGEPIVIEPQSAGSADMLLIPRSFLDTESAWGGTYDQAPRIMYGAGLQILRDRLGMGAVHDRLRHIAEQVAQ